MQRRWEGKKRHQEAVASKGKRLIMSRGCSEMLICQETETLFVQSVFLMLKDTTREGR